METLVLYDDEGKVFYSKENTSVDNVRTKIVNIPEGFYLYSINTETEEPIFKEMPKLETEKLREELQQAIIELTMLVMPMGMDLSMLMPEAEGGE